MSDAVTKLLRWLPLAAAFLTLGAQAAGGAEAGQDPKGAQGASGETLHGRVLGSDGLPSPGVMIRAQHAVCGNSKGYSLTASKYADKIAQLGPGEAQARAITNHRGEFTFDGLAAGRYFIWTKGSDYDHHSVYPTLLTEEPVAPGPGAIVLEHPQAGLLVVLTEPDGSPWPKDSAAVDDGRSSPTR